MAQQFDYPKTEIQLREIQDKLYQHSKEVYNAGGRPAFKGLLEVMSAEATIITAIHNIKGNRGSETPGVDSKTMRKDYLQRSHSWVIKDIQNAFKHFEPQKIRRVYADDFIIATDTRAHAENWKARLQLFLESKMKLTLSQEKTLITDIRKNYIKFLGYEFKMVRGKSRRGYIPRTIPDRNRLKRKAEKIAEDIKKIPRNYSQEQMIGAINRINSQVRGIIQYYKGCTWVNISMKKYSRWLQLTAMRRLKQYKGKWIPAKEVRNLPRVHQEYKQKIPSIKYRDFYIGFTALTFCRWERTPPKDQAETPYTEEGRQINFERTKHKCINARFDELYSDKAARAISYGKWGKLNNFEFIMNRAYALNRDKLRCRVCGGWLISSTPWAHRINPNLPLDKVNRVNSCPFYNLFHGLVYCATCGKSMQVRYEKVGRTEKNRFTGEMREPIDKAYYICQTYNRLGKNACTSHKIEARDLYNLVLSDIMEHGKMALQDAEAFYGRLTHRLEQRYSIDEKSLKKEQDALVRRNQEIDEMFMSLYVDKARGILTEQRFLRMTETLEQEQADNKSRMQAITDELRIASSADSDVRRFIGEIREYASITELDEAILNRLIDKIIISAIEVIDGEKVQKVRIVYNFVGEIEK